MSNQSPVKGVIAVIAKCPIPGKSKTRLIPLLGPEGSTNLAEAMLSDVLLTLEHCSALSHVHKILFYAPGTDDGLQRMTKILQKDLGLKIALEDSAPSEGWKLLPLISKTDLQASDLGDLLEYALERARQFTSTNDDGGNVVFLGMDSPVLPLQDIVSGLADSDNRALLCAADDGGYGMLCVPPQATSSHTFRDVLWSHPLTAVAQIKTLTDMDIPVRMGMLMNDIDEPDDVQRLCKRLSNKSGVVDDNSVLHSNAKINSDLRVASTHPVCFHTRKALIEFGQLDVN